MRNLPVAALGAAAALLAGASSVVGSPSVADAALAADAPVEFATSPVEDVVVVEAFDPPDQPWLAGHRGVDLEAHVGEAVMADRDGIVVFAGWVVDRPVVTIMHADGSRTGYEPVEASVEVGTPVTAGDTVGTVTADASHCDAPCVHWGLRVGGAYADPLETLRGFGPIALLPREAGAVLD